MKRPIALILTAVVGIFLIGILTQFSGVTSKAEKKAAPLEPAVGNSSLSKSSIISISVPAPHLSDSSQTVAQELVGEDGAPPSLLLKPNYSDTALREEMELLQRVFLDYRNLFKTNPEGNNIEITATLLGANPKGFHAEIPPGSKVNAKGEMVDRWETPYFFHQISGTIMEIRSAGPDQIHGTGDDTSVSY